MSNNAPDYENDLVFPPASADVHTTVIDRQIEIAVKALEKYGDKYLWCDGKVKLGVDCFGIKSQEITLKKSCYHDNGYKEAQEALRKIKEIKNNEHI